MRRTSGARKSVRILAIRAKNERIRCHVPKVALKKLKMEGFLHGVA